MTDTSDISIEDLALIAVVKAREEHGGEICITLNMTPKGGEPEKWRILVTRLHVEP